MKLTPLPWASRCLAALLLAIHAGLIASDEPVTHKFGTPRFGTGPRLELLILEASTGQPVPARFSLQVDGRDFVPDWVDQNGISFTSIHVSKQQQYTALYSRGTGPVVLGLPENARSVSVSAAKGFEYFAGEASARVEDGLARITIELSRWVDLKADGWIAVDEHLHYDRLDPADDPLWFTMLEADGLTAGHFMVLKGGMVPGIWSRQYAYGPAGHGTDGHHALIPGQEYRDGHQGHINLLGVNKVILPYSTGGMGSPRVDENHPPLYEVLLEARSRDAFAGVAHGGTLGRNPTHIADAVLGAVDFWEISNGFIYNTENWYRLMNCGYFPPLAAGTDLPNWPFRDAWQPLFGAIRTYVKTGGDPSFDAFTDAMRKGHAFISGGPLIDFQIEGRMMGETIHLPPEGGKVTLRAALHSPFPLRELNMVRNGKALQAPVRKRTIQGINRWSIEEKVEVTESCWFAAWGRGVRIETQDIDAMAHSNAIRILVGNNPVRSQADARYLADTLLRRRSFYRDHGVYEREADRDHALEVLERAVQRLYQQIDP